MNEIVIKQHSFEMAKNRLKEFSENGETNLNIGSVPTNYFLGLLDHKVTGKELNERLGGIQNNFIKINETNNKIIKEFREVYNALDVLDKDYITSIIFNVKAIEKTSNDVRIQQNILKQHNDRLENQQSKLDMHQTEIDKSIESISKIVTTLKIFKEKLEDYRHLTDIDQIWKDIEKHSSMLIESQKREEQFLVNFKAIEKTNDSIKTQQNKLDIHQTKIDKNIENFSKSITALKTFKEKLDTYEHLTDIDQIWRDIKKHSSMFIESQKREEQFLTNFKVIEKTNDDIKIQQDILKQHNEKIEKQQSKLDIHQIEIDKSIENFSKSIATLKTFKEKLDAYEHLTDIDQIWKDIEKHSSVLTESKKRDDILLDIIQKNKIKTNKYVIEVTQKTNDTLLSLKKKVKYTCWITGSAIGLAIFELILLFRR